MGCNYYFEVEEKPGCEHCGSPVLVKRIHIGKCSAGWTFALHVKDVDDTFDDTPHSLQDWYCTIENETRPKKIVDEYGRVHTLNDLRVIIECRKGSPMTPVEPTPRYAASGPNGLLRSRIDGEHCIGHGSGTWDFIVGEFS